MARLVPSTYEAAGSAFMSSGVVLMFVMLLLSISIMSLLIFACADDGPRKPRWKRRHGGDHGGFGGAHMTHIGGGTDCGAAGGGSGCGGGSGGGGGCGGGGGGGGGGC